MQSRKSKHTKPWAMGAFIAQYKTEQETTAYVNQLTIQKL